MGKRRWRNGGSLEKGTPIISSADSPRPPDSPAISPGTTVTEVVAASQSPAHILKRGWLSRGYSWYQRKCSRQVGRITKAASAISSVVAAVLLLIPKLSITSGVNLEPRNAFGTQFLIKNEGHVPVFHVLFSCKVVKSENFSDVSFIDPNNDVKILWPGETITGDCLVSASQSGETLVDTITSYNWPIWIIPSKQINHFSGRHGSAGFALVPGVALSGFGGRSLIQVLPAPSQ